MPDFFGRGDTQLGTRVPVGSRTAFVPSVRLVDGSGNPSQGQTYQLASNQTIAANSGTSPITVTGAAYLWDTQFTGTSIVLQTLGADATTWRDVATRTTSGTTGVELGEGAVVRLFNPNGASLTGVYSSLS